MNKISWQVIFSMIIMSAQLYGMQWLPNMSNVIEQRVTQRIRNSPFMQRFSTARNFCQQHGLPIIATAATVFTICNYDKPFIHAAGALCVGSLLMYKIVQLERRVQGLVETRDAQNISTLAWQRQQEEKQNKLGEQQAQAIGQLQELLPRITNIETSVNECNECTKSFNQKIATLNNEALVQLRSDLVEAKRLLDEVKASSAKQEGMLAEIDSNVQELDSNIKNLNVVIIDDIKPSLAKAIENITAEIDLREKCLEDQIVKSEKLFQNSLVQIKASLAKKGYVAPAWGNIVGRVGALSPHGAANTSSHVVMQSSSPDPYKISLESLN